jgi:hypothetical protein
MYKQPSNNVDNTKYDVFLTFLQWVSITAKFRFFVGIDSLMQIYSGDLYALIKEKKQKKRLLSQLKDFVKSQVKLSYLAVEIKNTVDRLALV